MARESTQRRSIWGIIVLLALAMALVLVGCSSSETSQSGQNETPNNGATEEQPEETGDSNGEEATDTLKIGVLLSFTGNFAPLAEDIQNGLELFFEERDYQIGNYKVEIKYEDDEADPQVALRKYNQLKNSENIDILIGPIPSNVLYALRDQVDQDKMLLIDANAAGDAISWDLKSDYIYRVFMSNWQVGHASGTHFADVGKTAVVIGPDYAAGHEVIDAFKAAYTANGGTIIEELWNDLGTNDFASYLTQIAQANPDIVYAVQAGTDAVRFMQQYKQFGLGDKIPLTAWHEFGMSLNVDPAGDAALDVLTAINYAPTLDNEVNKKFVEAYKAKYNETPSVFSVEGYDSGQIIAQAIEQTGTKDTEELIKVIKGMTFESPRGTIVLDEKTNNPIQDFYIARNVKGEDGEIVQEIIHTIPQVTMPETKPGS